MKVFTIIVTYNGMRWIEKSIKSVVNQSSIIVVDNNSTDGTVAFIEKNFSGITLLKQSENMGFGKANNIGFAYAIRNNADFVFLINQDVYVDDNAVARLVDVAQSNTDFGIISPMHFNGKGTALDRYFSFCASKNMELQKDTQQKQLSQIYSVPMVNGAAWFIPLKVIEDIGGFDPIFYHYGEDHNYCQRLLYHNYKIGIAPHICIRHDRASGIKAPIKLFSDAYYKKYENQLKINHANINTDLSEDSCSKQKIKYIKRIIKSILVLELSSVKGYFRQYKNIDPIFQSIYKSREITKYKGSHYLKLT